MALRAGDIIDAARFNHPSFDEAVIPNGVAARFLNEAQRRFFVAAHEVNQDYLIQRWVIALLPDQDIAQVGAGTGYGAPAVEGNPAARRDVGTGSLVTVSTESALLQAEQPASAGSTDTLFDSAASWIANAYLGQLVEITAGLGVGQVREILSNTTDTLVTTEDWSVIPDDTSLYVIRTNVESVTGSLGVEMGPSPVTRLVQGWLVKVDALGNAYLDLAQPIQIPMGLGIPMPPHYSANHGRVRFRRDNTGNPNCDQVRTLTLTSLSQQEAPPRNYSAAIVNGSLQLLQPWDQWRDVASIEIPYVPMCPAVTSSADYLLLPDTAEEALVSRVALRMGERSAAMGRMGDNSNLSGLAQRANDNESLYLNTVAGKGRATVSAVVTVW